MSVWLALCSSHINYKAPWKKEFGSGGLAPPDMFFFSLLFGLSEKKQLTEDHVWLYKALSHAPQT